MDNRELITKSDALLEDLANGGRLNEAQASRFMEALEEEMKRFWIYFKTWPWYSRLFYRLGDTLHWSWLRNWADPRIIKMKLR